MKTMSIWSDNHLKSTTPSKNHTSSKIWQENKLAFMQFGNFIIMHRNSGVWVKLYIFIHNEVWDFDKNSSQPSSRQWESIVYIYTSDTSSRVTSPLD
jgi:hypothetical protein